MRQGEERGAEECLIDDVWLLPYIRATQVRTHDDRA